MWTLKSLHMVSIVARHPVHVNNPEVGKDLHDWHEPEGSENASVASSWDNVNLVPDCPIRN